MRLSAVSLVEAGIQDGQGLKNTAPYALFGTPLETMCGEHQCLIQGPFRVLASPCGEACSRVT